MHTLFGITLVLYLLKLSAGKGFTTTACANYRGPVLPRYVDFGEGEYPEKTPKAQERSTRGT